MPVSLKPSIIVVVRVTITFALGRKYMAHSNDNFGQYIHFFQHDCPKEQCQSAPLKMCIYYAMFVTL